MVEPDCCVVKPSPFKSGILYGIIPHIGCILFILVSILSSAVLIGLFKPLLMNKYLFYWILGISFGFALISATLYLKKKCQCNLQEIRNNKGYLSIMLGTTIIINLLLFLFIFPLLANYVSGDAAIASGTYSTIDIKVNIPCSGHASLITGELKTLSGVKSVEFSFPNKFKVIYDQTTTIDQILNLSIFKTYNASIL